MYYRKAGLKKLTQRRKGTKINTISNALRSSLLLIFFAIPLYSQSLSYRGQASGWVLRNTVGQTEHRLGMRYIPEIGADLFHVGPVAVDVQASVNLYATRNFNTAENDNDAKLYRLWLRATTNQLEVRAGLQKINFGPAFILRSLMWFDSLDPRDPQQLTDGVYGVLLRYYFLNNANIWLWGLYGNDELRGTDIIYTQKDVPEWGGRVQYPIGPGEAAVTFHQRKTDLTKTLQSFMQLPFPVTAPGLLEHRYGLDGKWDLELGLWFETAVTRFEKPFMDYQYINQLTLGADYTLGLGNGLHITGEYMSMNLNDTFQIKDEYEFSALVIDYPINMFDRIMGMALYDHRNDQVYWYGSVQQTFDHWSVNTMFYWMPTAQYPVLPGAMRQAQFRGIQLMVVYTH